ncbi:MAG: hypothetical protein Q7W56_10595 [Candidatus Latescibacteria bacterium]|nr:hypothetical protein [Candidatus Latescibacterota bacterium]
MWPIGQSKRIYVKMAIFTSIALVTLVCGCDSDPSSPEPSRGIISEFTDFCFGDVDLSNVEVSCILVLDTINLPTVANGGNKLVLGEDPNGPLGGGPQIEFYFPEPLNAEIDPGLANQTGWKVALERVTVERCSSCGTNDGLARIVLLLGSIEDAIFIYDPADTLAVKIEHTELTH